MPAVDTLAAPDTPTAVETAAVEETTAAVEETTAAVEETSAAVEEMTAATSLLCTGTFVPPLISTQRKRGRSQEEEEDTDRDPPDEMASLKVRFKRLRTTRTGGHWYASSGEEDDARLDIELGLGMGKPAVAVTPPPWELTTSQTPTAASPKLPPAVRKSRRKRNI